MTLTQHCERANIMCPSVAPRAACNKTVMEPEPLSVSPLLVLLLMFTYSMAALTLLLRVDSQLDPGELYSTHIVT